MRPVEIIGTTAIGATCVASWHFAAALPSSVQVGDIALLTAVLILAQHMLREAVLVLQSLAARQRPRRKPPEGIPVALPLLIAIAALLFAGVDQSVLMSASRWWVAALAIMGCGFVTQDFHITLGSFRLRHDPDRVLLARLLRVA